VFGNCREWPKSLLFTAAHQHEKERLFKTEPAQIEPTNSMPLLELVCELIKTRSI